MNLDKRDILSGLSFGRRVAEEEVAELGSYFVTTDQWNKVLSGEVDVIFGAKGAGKSAIYSTLLSRDGQLFDKGITLVSAENPKGTPAFKDLVSDPPTSEVEFVGLWKLYILSLIGTVLIDFDIKGPDSDAVRVALNAEGLLPAKHVPLRGRVALILSFVRRILPKSLEGEVKLDPLTGAPIGFSTKISLGEPSVEQKAGGTRSVDELLQLANRALMEERLVVWLLFDRLDVAFAESRELEANGLRALFKCYLDLAASDSIRLKIFLRSDVWEAVAADGFREASHITRQMTISWSQPALLHLIVRRLASNVSVMAKLGEAPDSVLASAASQRRFFDQLVPDQVDAGKNPKSFEWILGRVQDGTRTVAPREVIHLLNEARDAQLRMLERGEEAPPNREIFSRQALRESLPPVSRVRLEQTIYAEYPELKPYIAKLYQEKTEQTPATLASIWGVSEEDAKELAVKLEDVGFFEVRGSKLKPRFWVPFLYRSALDMVQGAASMDDEART